MSAFSVWIKAIFISLAFSLYSLSCRKVRIRGQACTREYNPICATNLVTYANVCTFCLAV
uniref:Kazal-like domain-containing protein n=1 Tax=Jaculus jaculus TaxID=51337 RepID=A0A8C5P266_JACJA